MHSQFPFQLKVCPLHWENCLYFAGMNLYKFLLSHQVTIIFCLTPGDTHEQLDKKIVLPKVIIWYQRCENSWLKWKQTEYQLHSSFIQTLLIRFSQPRISKCCNDQLESCFGRYIASTRSHGHGSKTGLAVQYYNCVSQQQLISCSVTRLISCSLTRCFSLWRVRIFLVCLNNATYFSHDKHCENHEE